MLARTMVLIVAAVFIPALRSEPGAAIVAALSGDATETDGKGHSQTAHLFDWLGSGTVLETTTGGRLVIAFADGKRFELAGAAKVTIGAAGLKDESGMVRALDPLPPLPRLAAIANQAHASTKSGAIRVRGQGTIQGLYPREGFSALPDGTVLRFAASPEAASYKIDLEDDTGRSVFQIQTTSTEVTVPPGTLQAGVHYYWQVRGIGVLGISVKGEAEFTTLASEDISRRATFRAALSGSDADTMTTRAAVDLQLGLLNDARDELRLALAGSSRPGPIQQQLIAVQQQLEGLENTTR